MYFKRIAAVLFLLASQLPPAALSAPMAVPMERFITDHTRQYSQGDNRTVITWLSQAFWSNAMKEIPAIGERSQAALLKVTQPYLIFLIADGKANPYGATQYYPEALVRGTFRLKDSEGRLYAPLPEREVSDEVRWLTDNIRPVMAREFGVFGKGLKLLVFDNRDTDGKPLADPRQSGVLKIVALEREFVYQLPLATALPPKVDPKTGQAFPGTYNFNPYTGEPLPP